MNNVETALARAYELYKAGHYRDARALIDGALETEPTNTRALLGRALAFVAEGDLDNAELDLRRLLAIDPGHVGARYRLGEVYERRGDTSSAARAYRDVLMRSADHRGAAERLQALEIAPGKPSTHAVAGDQPRSPPLRPATGPFPMPAAGWIAGTVEKLSRGSRNVPIYGRRLGAGAGPFERYPVETLTIVLRRDDGRSLPVHLTGDAIEGYVEPGHRVAVREHWERGAITTDRAINQTTGEEIVALSPGAPVRAVQRGCGVLLLVLVILMFIGILGAFVFVLLEGAPFVQEILDALGPDSRR
jgi:hypothetical protein